jgi:thioredoxin-like negative regulator of GroEL
MASISKQSYLERLMWLALCFLGAASYTWFAIRGYWAQNLANRLDQTSLEKSIALEPRNATYHDLLCRSMIFVSGQPSQAISECMKSLALNSYNSSFRLDLAQAYFSSGEKQQCLDAVRRAIAVDPTTPDTAWSAANFFLIQGDNREALQQFALVLRGEPTLATPVLNICWQSLHDINRIQGILPPNPDIYLAFIKLLLSNGESAAARQIWSALMKLKQSFDYHEALFYIDGLLEARAVEDATDAWMQLASRSKAMQAYSHPDDLVVDGSFSEEILNSGFDWRYTPRPDIAVALDTTDFHSGTRSLSLTYSEKGSDAGLFEYIAVQPNTSYRLSAWVKSEELETANGPRLTLSDTSSNTINVATEETSGSTTWHQLEAKLQTGPQTKLLVLAILRSPGETRIQGKFWIDDISLRPM